MAYDLHYTFSDEIHGRGYRAQSNLRLKLIAAELKELDGLGGATSNHHLSTSLNVGAFCGRADVFRWPVQKACVQSQPLCPY